MYWSFYTDFHIETLGSGTFRNKKKVSSYPALHSIHGSNMASQHMHSNFHSRPSSVLAEMVSNMSTRHSIKVHLGRETHTRQNLNWIPGALNNGFLLVTGQSGSGKTNSVKQICVDLVQSRIPIWVLEPHNEFGGMGLTSILLSDGLESTQGVNPLMQYFADLGIQGNKGQSLTFGLWDAAHHSPKMKALAQMAAKNLGENLPDGFVSDVGKYFNKYAEDNHIIDPHILEKTDLYSKNPALKLIQKADEKLGGTISRPEKMTRLWAFNILAHYLYSAGFPKEKAAEMSEVATSISMVDYSRQSRPMIYNRLGMLGDMASTVTTFKHNAYTQLATYGVNKAPKTVLTMMGIQLLLGGLVGMYALDDADDVWSMAKSLFPETLKDTPGIKEMIMRNADEFWAFGGLAAGSRFIMPEGIDIGTKFSMDNLFPDSAAEAMFPLLSALVQTGEGISKFALAPTATNAAGIAYPMMPAPIKGVMESTVFSDEKGGYIPSKTDQLKTKRSFNEQMLRSTTGMRSLDERKESEIVFRTKNSRLRDEQLQQRYLDQAKTYSRDGDKKKTAQAIVKYMSNGGEWRNVNSFLERTYRGFVLDEIQRLSPKTLKTIRQQQQQLDLMEFQKDMEN